MTEAICVLLDLLLRDDDGMKFCKYVLWALLRNEKVDVVVACCKLNASAVTNATTNAVWQHKISAMYRDEALMVVSLWWRTTTWMFCFGDAEGGSRSVGLRKYTF